MVQVKEYIKNDKFWQSDQSYHIVDIQFDYGSHVEDANSNCKD